MHRHCDDFDGRPHAGGSWITRSARARRHTGPARSQVAVAMLAAVLGLASPAAHALELGWGPFTLTGFIKVEADHGTNRCLEDCQLFPDENKQRAWADQLRYGAPFGRKTAHVTLFQPWLTANFDLPGGWKLQGMLSQRFRDGDVDIPGFWYERNVAVSHEEYGSVRVGAMTTRSWSVADYPYGTNIGVADAWASSGAGYGLLTHALRYTSRRMDVMDGDVTVEVTYDSGRSGWQKNKPRLWEVYAQYVKGDLVVDAIYQMGRNGTPAAWGHGPFHGLTPFPQDDLKLGGSGQSIGMIMARYQIDRRWEASAGIRANRWSGAYARITGSTPGGADQWNEMFNVDWFCKDAMPSRCSIDNPGYAARSVDLSAGLRYMVGRWTASAGLTYLGKARTDNPSERGQSNWALINAVGLGYDFGNGLRVYGYAGFVHYGHLGLSPMSMPGNAAFTGVDSRVSRNGRWLGAGMLYVF